MANYIGMGRTNYFKVRDAKLFDKFCENYNLRKIINEQDLVGFLVDEGEPEAFDENGEEREDWVKVLQPILEEGQVCVFKHIGWEKWKYLVGYAIAFNSKEILKIIDISDADGFIPQEQGRTSH